MKITLNELKLLIDSKFYPKINTPSGLEKITDTYRKNGPGVKIWFNEEPTPLIAANNHLVWQNDKWTDVINLNVGDTISGKIISKIASVEPQDWIDFTIDADHESYYHQGILHHNSGKSLILYIIIRFLLKCKIKKILLIVPNTSLCHQLASDFADYSSHNSWDADKHIHLVFAGKDKDADKEIILSTWQSLYTIKDAKYFKQFDVVINDECFSGEMEVLTNNGYIKIKDINIGDTVLNFSEHTKEFKEDIVINTFQNLTKSNTEKMYKLEFDCGKIIEVTGNHKFLTDLGWVRADKLTDFHNIISYI